MSDPIRFLIRVDANVLIVAPMDVCSRDAAAALPDFGCNLSELLREPATPKTIARARTLLLAELRDAFPASVVEVTTRGEEPLTPATALERAERLRCPLYVSERRDPADAQRTSEAVHKCGHCPNQLEYIGKRRWRCPDGDCPQGIFYADGPPRVSPEEWAKLAEAQRIAKEAGERLTEIRERHGLPCSTEAEPAAPHVADLGCWVCRVLADTIKARAIDLAMYEGMIIGARIGLGAPPVLCSEHAERWQRIGMQEGLSNVFQAASEQRPTEAATEQPSEAFKSGYNAGKYAGETKRPYELHEAWATYRRNVGACTDYPRPITTATLFDLNEILDELIGRWEAGWQDFDEDAFGAAIQRLKLVRAACSETATPAEGHRSCAWCGESVRVRVERRPVYCSEDCREQAAR